MVDIPQIDLMAVVRNLIANATGLSLSNVILGQQSAPAPTGPYASVTTLTIINNGIDWTTNREASPTLLDATTKGSRDVAFSVQFFRESTFENVRALVQYPHTPNGEFFLQQNKMAWRAETIMSQVDAVLSAQTWENRTAITINLGFTEVTTQQINALESQIITIEHSGETDIQETIEIKEK